MNKGKHDHLPKSVRDFVGSRELKGDEVTSDVQVFLDQAREGMLFKKIVKIEVKPILLPGNTIPYMGYTIVAETGVAVTFIDPQLTGLARDVRVD